MTGKRAGKICGQELLNPFETNRTIRDAINSGEPFWVGRMGFTEMDFIRQVLQHRMIPLLDHRTVQLQHLNKLSGFFPIDMQLGEQFVDLLLEDAKGIDMQGFWNLYMEDYMYKVYQDSTEYLTQLNYIEPWAIYEYAKEMEGDVKPWSSALAGKKVLVIHPFADSIREQYEKNRTRLFKKLCEADLILPSFELKVLKAVQTLGGEEDARFHDWFEALNWMKSECRKVDFDVALIGCGAYGYSLVAEVKRMGKITIHLGGTTQMIFCVIGKRWETEYGNFFNNIVNQYWTRPTEGESIRNTDVVEQGCYW